MPRIELTSHPHPQPAVQARPSGVMLNCPKCSMQACDCGVCHICACYVGESLLTLTTAGVTCQKEIKRRAIERAKRRAKEVIKQVQASETEIISRAQVHTVQEAIPACCPPSGGRRIVPYTSLKQKIWKAESPADRLHFSAKRTIGVEIETDKHMELCDEWNTGLGRTLDKWTARPVNDGSIDGIEIVTAPASGDYFIKQINEICAEIKKLGGGVDGRCGLHTHVWVGDFSWVDLRRVIWAYAVIEPALFALCKSERTDNNYSQICASSWLKAVLGVKPTLEESKIGIVRAIYRTSYDSGKTYNDLRPGETSTARECRQYILQGKSSKAGALRYRAMNLTSVVHRGTIEFRHKEGTVAPAEIINWATLLYAFVEWCFRASEAEVVHMYNTHIKENPGDPFGAKGKKHSFEVLLGIVGTHGLLRHKESATLCKWMKKTVAKTAGLSQSRDLEEEEEE